MSRRIRKYPQVPARGLRRYRHKYGKDTPRAIGLVLLFILGITFLLVVQYWREILAVCAAAVIIRMVLKYAREAEPSKRSVDMIERDMEDLIQAFPDDFFPDRGFKFKERQTSFAGVGRFDLMFEDRYNRSALMELKAVPAKSDAVDQLIRYQEELRRRGETNIVLWLVAPLIPKPLTDLLDRFGIEYKEIHVAEYRHVAERRGFAIRSEMSGPDKNVEKVDKSRTSIRPTSASSTERALNITSGATVNTPPIFHWRANNYDLVLTNPERFEVSTFLQLVDAFDQAVPSRKNGSLIRELKQWAEHPGKVPWRHKNNASLLRWVTTSSFRSAVPHAWAIWQYLFGEPAPTWYVWDQGKGAYEFDRQAWMRWFDSLKEGTEKRVLEK